MGALSTHLLGTMSKAATGRSGWEKSERCPASATAGGWMLHPGTTGIGPSSMQLGKLGVKGGPDLAETQAEECLTRAPQRVAPH